MMTVGMRSRAVPVTPAWTNGDAVDDDAEEGVPVTRAGPPLSWSARACGTSGAAGDPVASDMEMGSVEDDRPRGDRENQAENELPQPQPPVLLGFLNVKPEPCIDET